MFLDIQRDVEENKGCRIKLHTLQLELNAFKHEDRNMEGESLRVDKSYYFIIIYHLFM